MNFLKNIYAIAFVLASTMLFAQTQLTGKVVDESNTGLPGASVVVEGTTDGASADFDGNFTLNTTNASGQVKVSFVGYTTKMLDFNGTTNFGTIQLMPSAESLDEVVIVGAGVIDLAEDRKTPIAVSTFKASEIKKKAANLDLPDLLTQSPSVQSVQQGGYGDGLMFLRGFNQSNTAFLLNGQPINGMEDGKMYWSNWSGVLDIANAVQVQRGLGSSKLAISSVGGTVNIVTKTIDKEAGGFVQGMVANDNYMKGTAYYSTGLMENGLAVGLMLGHWQGDGWRNGTRGQGQTYYLSLGYKPNERNIFNFLITGAPQWHGDAWEVSLADYLDSDEGGKLNPYYGEKDGEVYPGLRNFYHKPIANLSWDFNITDNSTLSTVLYGSIGRGGYAYMEGAAWGLVTGEDGGMDWDSLVESNNAAEYATGFQKGSYNGHNWYGLVSNFETDLNENVTFNLGADVRRYNGLHFRGAVDLMGDYGFENTSTFSGTYTIDNEYGGFNPWQAVFDWNNDQKQRYSYDYEEKINYYGVFGQVEYATDSFSAFFQGAVSNQDYQLFNYYNYESEETSDKINNLGYNVKAGLSYSFNDYNTTYVNGGYYSRQPFLDNIFENVRKSVDVNELSYDINETIIGVEFGHAINTGKWKVALDLYATKWQDRTNVYSVDYIDGDGVQQYYNFQVNGIEEIHKGVEFDIAYRPLENLSLKAFTSVGDWDYGQEPIVKVYDDATGNEITSTYEGTLTGDYEEGDKIGGAPQFSAGLGMNWEVFKNFDFDVSQRFYDNLYSLGGLKLPAYSLADAGVSYNLPFESTSIDFTFNVRNLFDEFYINYAETAIDAMEGDRVWKGINTENTVRIGFGRTWNASVRFNF